MGLENVPRDIEQASLEVLKGLRANQTTGLQELTSRQQRQYDELSFLCLSHLIEHPSDALFRRLGANEEAYGADILRIEGASLRVDYYTDEGSNDIQPGTFDDSPIDTRALGTPHNHTGHIAAAVPIGRLVHHVFEETEGDDYVAGNIKFEVENGSYRSVFTPTRNAGLESVIDAEFNPDHGYRMHRRMIHIVSWPEPTVTVWFLDNQEKHQSTTYNQAGVSEEIERERILEPQTQEALWNSFSSLVHEHM